MFLVTDPRGTVITSLGGVTLPSLQRNLDLVQTARRDFPQQASGFYLENGELYHLSVTPVYVQSAHGQNYLLNVLVAGYRVDALVAQQLKEATNSEFLFLTPSGVIASTLNPRATGAVVADLARKHGEGACQRRRHRIRALGNAADGSGRAARWARSASCARSADAQRRIASMNTNIVMLWLLAIVGRASR